MMRKTGVWRIVACGGALACLAPMAHAGDSVAPGTVIFDMDTNIGFYPGTDTRVCDPDYWSFFGYPTVDFGSNGVYSEDGHAIFTAGDWAWCDLTYGPAACQFLGAKHGGGVMCCGQPLCGGYGSGVRDANLDLSQGTGITLRVRLILPDQISKPGVRLQFELTDTNGLGGSTIDPDTTAVVPRSIPTKPFINRAPPLAEDGEWHTYTFWFVGLDSSFDASAIAGTDPLDLTDINAFKTIWRRGENTAGDNVIVFDHFVLIEDAPVLWADADSDGDVDLDDFREFQRCFDVAPADDPTCTRMDANYDSTITDTIPENDVINIDDFQNFLECMQGPDVVSGFPAWCY